MSNDPITLPAPGGTLTIPFSSRAQVVNSGSYPLTMDGQTIPAGLSYRVPDGQTSVSVVTKFDARLSINQIPLPASPSNGSGAPSLPLPNLQAALALTKANVRSTNIAVQGDSNTIGTGTTNRQTTRPWQLGRAIAAATSALSQVGIVIPTGAASADTNGIFGGNNGVIQNNAGFGVCGITFQVNNGSNPGNAFCKPGVAANAWDVWYVGNQQTDGSGNVTGGNGPFTVQALGAPSAVAATGTQPLGIYKMTVTTPNAPDPGNYIAFNVPANTNLLVLAVRPYIVGTSQVLIDNLGVSGSTYYQWGLDQFGGHKVDSYAALKAFAPDVIVSALITNEGGNNDASGPLTPQQMGTAVTNFAAFAHSINSDLVLWTPMPASISPWKDHEPANVAAAIAAAQAAGALVIDPWDRNYHGAWNTVFAFNELHGNDAGKTLDAQLGIAGLLPYLRYAGF